MLMTASRGESLRQSQVFGFHGERNDQQSDYEGESGLSQMQAAMPAKYVAKVLRRPMRSARTGTTRQPRMVPIVRRRDRAARATRGVAPV
jgi:hypothetical protein